MNMSLRCLIIISFSLGWVAPLLCATWYSQSSGVWGDTGTPGLWNTDPNGAGLSIDGTDAPTSGDNIVIQANHQVEIVDFGVVANMLDIGTLRVEPDAVLFGSAVIIMNVHGATVTVDGAINFPSLSLESGSTGAFKTLTGVGSANLQMLSFANSLQFNLVSINLNTTLNTDFYPFNNAAVNGGDLTIGVGKTLKVLGSVYLDGDAISNFALNNFELFVQMNINGKLEASGNFHMGNNNFSFPFLINIGADGTLELANGAIIAGAGLGGVGSIMDNRGTYSSGAADPLQGLVLDPFSVVQMNVGSTCRLTGGANQILDTDSASSQYYDVELAGTGPKVLDGDVEITNDLSMGTILELRNHDLFLSKMFTGGFFGGNPSIPVYGASSYIETNGSGKLRMFIPGNSGSGSANVSFPVGNGSFTPLVVTNGSASSDYFDIQVITGVNPSGAATTTDYVNKTWRFQPATAFTDNLAIQFYWNVPDEQANFNRSGCWGSRYDSGWDWSFPINVQFATNVFGVSQYAVQRSGISSFGAFTVTSDQLLPVELLSFNGSIIEAGHQLEWITASELNNSHFEIEHSLDGKKFAKVGEVTGQGSTQEENAYSWTYRPGVSSPFHYYRLKQIDFDGQYAYSDVVVIESSTYSSGEFFSMYPNPASDQLQIQLTSERLGLNQMYIFSMDGRQLWQRPVATGDLINLSLSHWPSGMYVIRGRENGGRLRTLGRIVKE